MIKLEKGLFDKKTGIYGWDLPIGTTGLFSLENGYYYIFQTSTTPNNNQCSTVFLYKYDNEKLLKICHD